jgi:hypothetical protein
MENRSQSQKVVRYGTKLDGVSARKLLRLIQFILTKPYLEKEYNRSPREFVLLTDGCEFLSKLKGNFAEKYGKVTESICELFAIQGNCSNHNYEEDLTKITVEHFLKAVMSFKEYRSFECDEHKLDLMELTFRDTPED